ncbi:MAG: DUF3644 domain-containing protein [Gemmatales bacterium]|nr:DUF3644 domain-containing protein [Gemmatales bacterium]MDW7995355.1 DUF3644 domain-containing protein [Gemmatales bacterium]
MKSRSRELLDHSISAMLAAIEIYNKPTFPYRIESFLILALNAWELLVKAKWLSMNRNRLSSLYVPQGKGTKKPRYKRTRSGNPMTHSLDYLVKKLTEQQILEETCSRNLHALMDLRDTVVHFYHRNNLLSKRLQEIALAAVKNFFTAVQDWFKKDLSDLNTHWMPISFVSPPVATDAVEFNKEEKRFLRYIDELAKSEAGSDSKYAVAMKLEVHFVRSKAASAAPVRLTSDPNAPAVRLTEEQMRERYQLDYEQLTRMCRERYTDFKVDKKYHKLRKELASDQRYAYVRTPRIRNQPKRLFIARQYWKHWINTIRGGRGQMLS